MIKLSSFQNLQTLSHVPKIWRQRFFSGYFNFRLEQIRDRKEENELFDKVKMRTVIRMESQTNAPEERA